MLIIWANMTNDNASHNVNERVITSNFVQFSCFYIWPTCIWSVICINTMVRCIDWSSLYSTLGYWRTQTDQISYKQYYNGVVCMPTMQGHDSINSILNHNSHVSIRQQREKQCLIWAPTWNKCILLTTCFVYIQFRSIYCTHCNW